MDPKVPVPFDDLKDTEVVARDGLLGHLETLLFDDTWTVRWLVVESNTGTTVLVPAEVVERWDPTGASLYLGAPASRTVHRAGADPALARADRVLGMPVHARDGRVGRVAEIVIDAATWAIRWLDVDTQSGFPHRHVLLAPRGVARLAAGRIELDATADAVRDAPPPPPGLRCPL